MALYKNTASQKLAVYAYDTAAEAPKTGDAANITGQISKDGAATAATNDTNPTELDATDAPGVYLFDLTQAETNAEMIVVSASSTTSDISIEPVVVFTFPTDLLTLATTYEGSEDLQDLLRLMRAVLVGKSTGGGSSTITFRDAGDSKARITATVDSSGNRTAMTTDAT